MLCRRKGRALTALMPANRVLTETDGPFGIVSGKPLRPGACAGAIRVLSELWQLDAPTTQRTIVASLRELTTL